MTINISRLGAVNDVQEAPSTAISRPTINAANKIRLICSICDTEAVIQDDGIPASDGGSINLI